MFKFWFLYCFKSNSATLIFGMYKGICPFPPHILMFSIKISVQFKTLCKIEEWHCSVNKCFFRKWMVYWFDWKNRRIPERPPHMIPGIKSPTTEPNIYYYVSNSGSYRLFKPWGPADCGSGFFRLLLFLYFFFFF